MGSSDWFHRGNKSFLKAFATYSVFFSLRRNLRIIDMLYCAIVSSLLALGLIEHLLFPFSYPTPYWFQFLINCIQWRKMQSIISCILWFQGWPLFFNFFCNHLHFLCHFELTIMHSKLYICRLSENQFFKRK